MHLAGEVGEFVEREDASAEDMRAQRQRHNQEDSEIGVRPIRSRRDKIARFPDPKSEITSEARKQQNERAAFLQADQDKRRRIASATDGARNAFYGRSLLSSVLGHDGPWSAVLHLVRDDENGVAIVGSLALEDTVRPEARAIDAGDGLNAFVHKTPEIALEQARARDGLLDISLADQADHAVSPDRRREIAAGGARRSGGAALRSGIGRRRL